MNKRAVSGAHSSKSDGARTVGRVLGALELLSDQTASLRLVDIARALNLPTSSAHALLQQLIKYDYVKQAGDERRYVHGPGLVLLASRVRTGLQLVKVARPLLEDTASSIGENTYLGMRQSHGIAYVDSVEADAGVTARFPLGSIRPLHASSPGKLFLAFYVPKGQIDYFLGPHPLQAFTRYTTIDRAKLRQQLDDIRVAGFAVNEQEAVEGAYGISAPIFGGDKALVGSITIAMPGLRFKSRKKEAIKKCVAAAAEISRRLGVPNWRDVVKSFSN